jgi:sugar/nucleoside kinase (ribokinase family)
VSELAAIGPLSRDVVAGAPPRPGGTAFYAAGAFARLRADAAVAVSCADADRETLLQPLRELRLPLTWYESRATTSYRFHYEAGRRVMVQDAVADAWSPEQARAGAGAAAWVHVGGLARSDFPPATLAALAHDGRMLLVDAQGLVRRPELGPLRTDAEIGSALEHVGILKVDREEAVILAGAHDPDALRALGVPEVLLTLGEEGALVVARDTAEHVPAPDVGEVRDPTGAGDTLAASYLVARSRDATPGEAVLAATDTVAAFLADR